MLKPRYLVGFSGHRAGYDENLIRPALKAALEDLQKRTTAAGGEIDLYASIAEGTDTLCVETARELSMPVHVLLPLTQADFEKDFSPSAWDRSRKQIELAATKPGRDSVRVLPGEMVRPDCYFDQGIQILDAVDVLIAVWDGEKARGLGGTEQIVSQAMRTGIPVVIIDSKTSRSRIEGDLNAAFKPDEVMTELQEVAEKTGAGCAAQAGNADELQKCLDDIAKTEAARFRPSLVVIILLHGIAALLAAVVTFKFIKGTPWDAPWESWKWVITAVELLLVGYALYLGWALHRKHSQERWLRCRFAAELVRGFRASVPLIDPLSPSIAVHDPKWRRFALSASLLVNAHRATLCPRALRDDYIATRLSETHPDGQIRHYQEMNEKALRWWSITGVVSKWSALLAPPFVAISLANKLSKLEGLQGLLHGPWKLDEKPATWPIVVLFPIALPLLAGVANGIRHALDAGRRKERYPEMAKRLTEMRTHLGGLETRASISLAVAQTEEILLDELREWQLTAKTTGH